MDLTKLEKGNFLLNRIKQLRNEIFEARKAKKKLDQCEAYISIVFWGAETHHMAKKNTGGEVIHTIDITPLELINREISFLEKSEADLVAELEAI